MVIDADFALSLTVRFHWHVANFFNSFLWKLSLNARAVHYGIESGMERVAENLKNVGHSSTFCKHRAKNAGRQPVSEKMKREQGVNIVFIGVLCPKI